MPEEKELGIFEKFLVTCRKCGSVNIEMIDSRGSSEESGMWGEVELHCVDCDNCEDIIE